MKSLHLSQFSKSASGICKGTTFLRNGFIFSVLIAIQELIPLQDWHFLWLAHRAVSPVYVFCQTMTIIELCQWLLRVIVTDGWQLQADIRCHLVYL